MGRRALKNKKGLAYDSDEDDSASSSSTSRSVIGLAHGIDDFQLDDDNILDLALDALHEKRGSTRENALSSIVDAFTSNLQHEFIEYKFVTLLHLSLNSIKKGTMKEKSLACRTIGLLALTVGCGDKAREILQESVPIIYEALKTPSESSPGLLECLSIITFVGGDNSEETTNSMQIMWQLVHPKLFSSAGPKNMSASVIASMVSAWAFLVTTIDRWTITSKEWKGSFSYLSALLDKDDRSIRMASGEALALLFEMEITESLNSEGLINDIADQMKILSMEAGGKGSAKKDLNIQRFLFRDILKFLEDGSTPETSLKIGCSELRTSSWHEMIQLNFLKRFLAGGFIKHMLENEFLHEVFGFSPTKVATTRNKKMQIYANSAIDKKRTIMLKDRRKLLQDMNVGHFCVGVENE